MVFKLLKKIVLSNFHPHGSTYTPARRPHPAYSWLHTSFESISCLSEQKHLLKSKHLILCGIHAFFTNMQICKVHTAGCTHHLKVFPAWVNRSTYWNQSIWYCVASMPFSQICKVEITWQAQDFLRQWHDHTTCLSCKLFIQSRSTTQCCTFTSFP